MAANDKTEEVEVTDDSIVTVDVSDMEGIATEVTAPAPSGVAAATPTAADEAAAALTEARKKIEDEARARQNAEAAAAAERRRADEAHRLAQQRGQEADGYREQAETHQLSMITSGIEAAKRELEALQTEYAQAMEAGEFKQAAVANSKMNQASSRLVLLEDKKETLSARRPTTEGRVAAPERQAATSLEEYIDHPTFAPAAKAWLRAHPECAPPEVGGNIASNAKMMQGHWAALAQGFTANTPDYFRVIEEHTGHRAVATATTTPPKPTEEGGQQRQASPQQRQRQAQPSAPVSREPPGPSGATPRQRTVALSKEQQEIALLSFPAKAGEAEPAWKKRAFGTYAYHLLEATAEGKIGRQTH